VRERERYGERDKERDSERDRERDRHVGERQTCNLQGVYGRCVHVVDIGPMGPECVEERDKEREREGERFYILVFEH
jgi:hypothetical protein